MARDSSEHRTDGSICLRYVLIVAVALLVAGLGLVGVAAAAPQLEEPAGAPSDLTVGTDDVQTVEGVTINGVTEGVDTVNVTVNVTALEAADASLDSLKVDVDSADVTGATVTNTAVRTEGGETFVVLTFDVDDGRTDFTINRFELRNVNTDDAEPTDALTYDINASESAVDTAPDDTDARTEAFDVVLPKLVDYTNSEAVVDTDALRQAIDDWRGDDIDTGLLRTAIDAWRSSEPVPNGTVELQDTVRSTEDTFGVEVQFSNTDQVNLTVRNGATGGVETLTVSSNGTKSINSSAIGGIGESDPVTAELYATDEQNDEDQLASDSRIVAIANASATGDVELIGADIPDGEAVTVNVTVTDGPTNPDNVTLTFDDSDITGDNQTFEFPELEVESVSGSNYTFAAETAEGGTNDSYAIVTVDTTETVEPDSETAVGTFELDDVPGSASGDVELVGRDIPNGESVEVTVTADGPETATRTVVFDGSNVTGNTLAYEFEELEPGDYTFSADVTDDSTDAYKITAGSQTETVKADSETAVGTFALDEKPGDASGVVELDAKGIPTDETVEVTVTADGPETATKTVTFDATNTDGDTKSYEFTGLESGNYTFSAETTGGEAQDKYVVNRTSELEQTRTVGAVETATLDSFQLEFANGSATGDVELIGADIPDGEAVTVNVTVTDGPTNPDNVTLTFDDSNVTGDNQTFEFPELEIESIDGSDYIFAAETQEGGGNDLYAVVTADKTETVEPGGETAVGTFELDDPNGSATGEVVLDGPDVPDGESVSVTIEASSDDGSTVTERTITFNDSNTNGDTLAYEFAELEPGNYTFEATVNDSESTVAGDYAIVDSKQSVRIKADESTPVEAYSLDNVSGSISGEVELGGADIPPGQTLEVTVTVNPVDGGTASETPVEFNALNTTNDTKTYRVNKLEPGEYNVSASVTAGDSENSFEVTTDEQTFVRVDADKETTLDRNFATGLSVGVSNEDAVVEGDPIAQGEEEELDFTVTLENADIVDDDANEIRISLEELEFNRNEDEVNSDGQLVLEFNSEDIDNDGTVTATATNIRVKGSSNTDCESSGLSTQECDVIVDRIVLDGDGFSIEDITDEGTVDTITVNEV